MGPTTIQGQHLRTEDGATFTPPTNNFQLPIWTYVRLEDGSETLWGPQGLNDSGPKATVRVEFGEVRNLDSGTAP